MQCLLLFTPLYPNHFTIIIIHCTITVVYTVNLSIHYGATVYIPILCMYISTDPIVNLESSDFTGREGDDVVSVCAQVSAFLTDTTFPIEVTFTFLDALASEIHTPNSTYSLLRSFVR